MIDREAPDTRWATYKRQVINLWNCCISLVDLFELCDDALTCERLVIVLPFRPILVPAASFPNSLFMVIFRPFNVAWRNSLKASVKHEEQRIQWNRFLISKIKTVDPREQKFTASYKTRIFIIVATRTGDWYLSSTSWIHPHFLNPYY
jgi:hypothetical protein